MKKTLRSLLIILSVMPFAAIGQNMVHNPSFEEYSSCPDENWQISKCNEWACQSVLGGMSYFNSCDNGANSVPSNNLGGSLPAFSGQAYVGTLYYCNASSVGYPYLIGTLTPLQIGNCYQVSIHLCNTHHNGPFNINGWGAFFYKDGIPSSTNEVLNVQPQIDYDIDYGVVDGGGWKELTSTFIADSAYQKIVVGCFNSPQDLTVTPNPQSQAPGYATYFIDSVSVTPYSPPV